MSAGEQDWNDAFLGIQAGLVDDTAYCKNGGHLIHRTGDGEWAGDDGERICTVSAQAGPHEPIQMPRQGRSGAHAT